MNRFDELVPRTSSVLVPAPRTARGWLLEFVTPPAARAYLAAGERVLIATRRHWVVPFRDIARAFVMMSAVGVLTMLLAFVAPGVFLLQAILWLVALAHTAYLGWCVVLWRVEQLAVTNTRVIRVHGVFTITVDSVQLSQITDVALHRSVAGRILGYGTLRIESAGQDQAITALDYLPRPSEVYRATLR